jgi:hypothetical protein
MVPYRMDKAMGVVKAVVAVVLGSRRDKPPLDVDCLAMAREWGGRVDWAVNFWRQVSVQALIRWVNGPFHWNGFSNDVVGSAWW